MRESDGESDEVRQSGVTAADDHELLRRTAAGDRDAFRHLVQRHQKRILVLAYRFLGQWHAAEDVCQEALIRTFENASRIKPEAKVTTWLYRVVANLCLDSRRRITRVRQPLTFITSISAEVPDPVEREETQAAIRQAIADLPDRQRMVIILHRFDGMGQREIAEITGWSASAVESCLVRAYASLRTKLVRLNSE